MVKEGSVSDCCDVSGSASEGQPSPSGLFSNSVLENPNICDDFAVQCLPSYDRIELFQPKGDRTGVSDYDVEEYNQSADYEFGVDCNDTFHDNSVWHVIIALILQQTTGSFKVFVG